MTFDAASNDAKLAADNTNPTIRPSFELFSFDDRHGKPRVSFVMPNGERTHSMEISDIERAMLQSLLDRMHFVDASRRAKARALESQSQL